jgi:hypothetical protein
MIFTAARTIVMCGLTQDFLNCYVCMYYCWCHLGTSVYQNSSITPILRCMSAITTEPLSGGSSTRSNKPSTGAAFNHWARMPPLILVSGMGLTHPCNGGFNFMAAELMLQVLQNSRGMLLVWSPYTTAFYMHVNHIINRCFNLCIRPAQRTFLQCSVLNKYVCLFSTVWTA